MCKAAPMQLTALPYYAAAAISEIAGCFAFWAWLRLGKPALWLIPGVLSLILFAWLLTRVDAQFAGRAYAAYGGIYILASSLLTLRIFAVSLPPLREHVPECRSVW